MPTAESQAWAKTVLSTLPISLRSVVVQSTAQQFESMKAAHMEFADDPNFKINFLQDFYYQNMEKIITANKGADFRFVPALPISMIPDITEQRALETLICNATSVEVDSFQKILAKRKQESLEWVQKEKLAEVQEMWVNKHYWAIFKEVMSGISVGAGQKRASQADTQLEDSTMQVAIVQDMFASPRKRPRNETVPAAQEGDATIASNQIYLHIAEIHLRENDFPRGTALTAITVAPHAKPS